jgi:hypothetical protein
MVKESRRTQYWMGLKALSPYHVLSCTPQLDTMVDATWPRLSCCRYSRVFTLLLMCV